MSAEGLPHRGDRTPDAPDPAAAPAAGVVRRLIATLIDMLVFCTISALLAYPLVGGVDWSSALVTYDDAVRTLSEPTFVTHATGLLGLWAAAWWCYFVVGWGGAGATPGKRLLGLCLIDHQGRYPIGMARAALRLVAYMVSSLTLGFGHLLVGVRADRRALHDILAGTRVVRRPRGLRRTRGPGRDPSEGSTQEPKGPDSGATGEEEPGNTGRDQEAVLQ